MIVGGEIDGGVPPLSGTLLSASIGYINFPIFSSIYICLP